jgi:hypothetical protein
MNEWTMTFSLLRRGARWGDLEVFTVDENLEILTRPSRKSSPKLVTMTVKTKLSKAKTFAEKLAQFSMKKTCSLKCKSCSYQRNLSPPEHFTQEQKNHCCAYCLMSDGKSHGDRCQRIL